MRVEVVSCPALTRYEERHAAVVQRDCPMGGWKWKDFSRPHTHTYRHTPPHTQLAWECHVSSSFSHSSYEGRCSPPPCSSLHDQGDARLANGTRR